MLFAALAFPSVFSSFGIEGVRLAPSVYLQALLLAVLLALAASAWPAWRASAVDVVVALNGRRR
jgi:ABC-type lipoprotein release transport system permease subunit